MTAKIQSQATDEQDLFSFKPVMCVEVPKANNTGTAFDDFFQSFLNQRMERVNINNKFCARDDIYDGVYTTGMISVMVFIQQE